jgi:hypothetical protein
MEYGIAAQIMRDLSSLSVNIHRPLNGKPLSLSDEEWYQLKHLITDVWGSVYFDMMVPLIRNFPDLDPDSRVPKIAETSTPVSPDTTTRAELGHAIVLAAQSAEADLKSVVDRIEAFCTPDEAVEYRRRAVGTRNNINRVREFAVPLLER